MIVIRGYFDMKKEKSSKIICLRLLNINLLDSQQTFVLGGRNSNIQIVFLTQKRTGLIFVVIA